MKKIMVLFLCLIALYFIYTVAYSSYVCHDECYPDNGEQYCSQVCVAVPDPTSNPTSDPTPAPTPDPAAAPMATASNAVATADDAVEESQNPENQSNLTNTNEATGGIGENETTAGENTGAANGTVTDTKTNEDNASGATDTILSQNNTPETGDPVKIATGAYTTSETDFSYGFGDLTVKIARVYQSDRAGSHSSGRTWSFNYDTRIIMGVKPNAAGEAGELARLAGETLKLYNDSLKAYNDNLPLITATHDTAVNALQLANEALSAAETAYNIAHQNHSSKEVIALLIWQDAQKLQLSASKWEEDTGKAEQDLRDSYPKIQGIYNDYINIQAMADQSAKESGLATGNAAKNLYVINSSDPVNLVYTGNTTVTLIDEGGTPHLYRMVAIPNYDSTVNYAANGQKNFFPTGSALTASVPTDDKLELLPDGSYRLTKKNKSQYLYSFYGQLIEIRDVTGNRLSFDYSPAHELTKISDDYGRKTYITRENGKIVKITDPKNRDFKYSYNSAGLLASRTDPENATVSYVYDGNLITRINKPDGSSRNYHYITLNGQKVIDQTTDEEGNTETFTYLSSGMNSEYRNASGILERHYYNDRFLTTKIEYSDGNFVTMDYDNENNLIRSQNELSEVTQFSYDQNHNLTKVIDPDNWTESWTYNDFNRVISHTDKMNNTTSYNYDILGNLTTVIFPDNTSIRYSYNSRGQVTEAIDQLFNKTTYTYDLNGHVSAVKDPLGKNEYFENDVLGNVLKYTDQTGQTTLYEYNGDDKVTKVTDPNGKTEVYTYNNRKDLIQYTDKNGNATRMEYDKRHLLVKSTDPLGVTTEYTYRPDGKVSAKTVNGINHTAYEYDQRGNLASVTQVETGAITRYEYNGAGEVTAVIDPWEKRTEYGYTRTGTVQWVKDPDGYRKSYTYNSNGKVTSITDERYNTTLLQYDKLNRLTKVTDPNNNNFQYGYDAKGNLAAFTDKNGNVSRFEYDTLGRLVKSTDPTGNYEKWELDARGMAVGKTDKNGNKTTFVYDNLKRLTKVTDPLNGIRQYTYDPVGNILARTDENNVTTNYLYDALNRVTTETDAKGNRTLYQYNYLGLVSQRTDALNNVTSYEYDTMGCLTKETDPLGASKTYQYDRKGNLTKETDEGGYSSLYTYDSLNRLVEAVDALNQKTKYEYDPKGNLVKLTNPKGDIYRYEYDPADRMVKEVDLQGQAKTYALDPNGNKIAQTDFNGKRMDYKYDKLNRLSEVDFPDGTTKQFAYDPVGNLTRAFNDTADERFYYNELSQLVKAETLNLMGTQKRSVEFTYDKAGDTKSMTTSVEAGQNRSVGYLYDELNRLSKATFPDGATVDFKYDALSRVAEKINANGASTVYSYTSRSEVESIINYKDANHSSVLGSYGYLYNAKGERTFQIEGNGDLSAYQYDPAGRISKVYYPFRDKKKSEDYRERNYYGMLSSGSAYHFKPDISELANDKQVDIGSQIREFAGKMNGAADGSTLPFTEGGGSSGTIEDNASPEVSFLNLSSIDRMKLDGLYQKIRQNDSNYNPLNGFWAEEYTYDPNGNIAKKKNGWGDISYQYNAANQLTQAGNRKYQYDPNGNLIKESLGASFADYQYDYENRLVKATNQFQHFLSEDDPFVGDIVYSYDALGRKVKKEKEPLYNSKYENEYYIYNGLGLDVLAEYKTFLTRTNHGHEAQGGKTEEIDEYYYGNGSLLAMKVIDHPEHGLGHYKDELQGVSFYHLDALGSVAMLTGRNGQEVERYEYDAFGHEYNGRFEQNQNKANPYGFTGQRFETELGVYSFAFREYNPKAMRWTTEDPVKDGMNWYQYCNGDPVNLVDPNGQTATEVVTTWIATDTVIPDPSDIVVWKWVGYGVATIAGVAIDAVLSNDNTKDTTTTTTVTTDISTTKKKEDEATTIYRWGSGTNTNLTPRPQDVAGISYSLTPPPTGKYTTTTIEAVNETGVLRAVQDGPNHVSIVPTVITTLPDWIASRPDAETNPHPYTQILKSISSPCQNAN